MLIDFEDRVVLGAISGALAIILRDIYSFISKLSGFAKHLVWQIAADLFMKGDQTKTVVGNIVGFLADIALGAFLGVIFVYFIKYTNSKNIIWKGWLFGLAAWILIFGTMLHSVPQASTTSPGDVLSNLSAFGSHSLYGLGLGFFSQKLLQKYDFV